MYEDVLKKSDLLYSVSAIEDAISDIATRISDRYRHSDPVVICVLNGGLVFFGNLLPKMRFSLEVDYIHVTRYIGNKPTDKLKWIAGPNVVPADRTVILVDDILDEGTTLAKIVEYYKEAGAKKVVSVVLVEKVRNRKIDIKPDYVGLKVPDRYVFGYGMDYRGYLRNVPGIYAEKE